MIINRKIQNKTIGGGKNPSLALFHGKIPACRAARQRNIIMCTEGQGKTKRGRRSKTRTMKLRVGNVVSWY